MKHCGDNSRSVVAGSRLAEHSYIYHAVIAKFIRKALVVFKRCLQAADILNANALNSGECQPDMYGLIQKT